MPHNFADVSRARRALVASLALIAAACTKDSPTAVQAGNSLRIAGSYMKAGIVGQQVGGPMVVEIRNANGNAVAGQAVAFSVRGNGGTVNATSITDENGRAWALWTLGTVAGVDTLVATSGGQSVTFVAEAQAGSLAQFQMVAGDQQAVSAGSEAALVVRAMDAYGNPVSGAVLSWIDQSGGAIVFSSAVTDASGLARASLLTDADQGVQYLVSVQSADGSVSITFTVNGQ